MCVEPSTDLIDSSCEQNSRVQWKHSQLQSQKISGLKNVMVGIGMTEATILLDIDNFCTMTLLSEETVAQKEWWYYWLFGFKG